MNWKIWFFECSYSDGIWERSAALIHWSGLLTITLQSSSLSVNICCKLGHAASSHAKFLESGKVNLVPVSNTLNALLSQIIK